MIRHIVLFKLTDPSEEKLQRAIELFYTMKGNVPGLLDLEAGKDVYKTERSYDLALSCLFENREALDAYQTHPLHQVVRNYMHSVRESSVACDYETK